MSDIENHRNFPRSPVELDISVNTGNEQVPGKILNLTVEGVSLELEGRLEVGDSVEIEIHHNEWVKKNQLRAEVVRCEATDTEPFRHMVAAKFIEPNDDYLMDALALVHGKPLKREQE